jgi:hypothetical protein
MAYFWQRLVGGGSAKPADLPAAPLEFIKPKKINDQKFHALKEQALDLIDWVFADMSPDEKHMLSLKVGIEREGHFLPHLTDVFWQEASHPYVAKEAMPDTEFAAVHNPRMESMAEILEKAVRRSGEQPERVYAETCWSFLLEPTTKPMSARKAAASMTNICAAMARHAEDYGYTHCFGDLPVSDYARQVPHFAKMFNQGNYFETPKPYLPGMGQHVNVSPWCGAYNLFTDGGKPQHAKLSNTVYMAVEEAAKTVPSMMLLCRNGNYRHLVENTNLAPLYTQGKVNIKGSNAFGIVIDDQRASDIIYEVDSEQTRIEFRQNAADAQPIDAVLASTIPVAKTIIERATLDKHGKAIWTGSGLKGSFTDKLTGYKAEKLPDTLEKAREAFNPVFGSNPNFAFLDKLADMKIKRLTEAAKKGGAAAQHALREAQELRYIGTRLHHGYCQRHGMESHMPLPITRGTHLL